MVGLLVVLTACTPGAAAPIAAPSSAVPPATTTTAPDPAAPVTDLPGWTLQLHEDFTTDAALGDFDSVYPGWAAYDGYRDTSRVNGRPLESQGRYASDTTTTVHDGTADMEVHTEGVTPQVMALTPGPAQVGQLYGRYSIRVRSDRAADFKFAFLLWPVSEQWAQGELDFPEATLGDDVYGYAHDVTGDPSRNAWSVRTGSDMSSWHTATIEWEPGRVTYVLDDLSWTTTDPAAVPTHPMRPVVQVETQVTAQPPDPAVRAHVLVDWIAVWSRD
ncbi:hypothetical protein GCM10028783_32050 [Modestobacter muralis]